MKPVLVVAPHPDDETLGCGGLLLRFKKEGRPVHWLIATEMGDGYSPAARAAREKEISATAKFMGFKAVHRLGFPASSLDAQPASELIGRISAVVKQLGPELVLLPHPSDAHSDHGCVFRAAFSALKVFRQPTVKEILCYETLSETGFGPRGVEASFNPTAYFDVTPFLEKKIRAFGIFSSEIGRHPFPRSARAIEALAVLRGSEAGVEYAEAFQVLKLIR